MQHSCQAFKFQLVMKGENHYSLLHIFSLTRRLLLPLCMRVFR